MKEIEKKLETYRKMIFLYLKETYSDDKFLKNFISEYEHIDNKIKPFYEMAERSKDIMDKIIKDVKPVDTKPCDLKLKQESEKVMDLVEHSPILTPPEEFINQLKNEYSSEEQSIVPNFNEK